MFVTMCRDDKLRNQELVSALFVFITSRDVLSITGLTSSCKLWAVHLVALLGIVHNPVLH